MLLDDPSDGYIWRWCGRRLIPGIQAAGPGAACGEEEGNQVNGGTYLSGKTGPDRAHLAPDAGLSQGTGGEPDEKGSGHDADRRRPGSNQG